MEVEPFSPSIDNETTMPQAADDLFLEDFYTPLERPALPKPDVQSNQRQMDIYPDDSESASSESASDSGNEHRGKKLKMKKRHIAPLPVESKTNKFSVWSSVQEDALTETLIGCDVSQNSIDRSRNVESYDYKKYTNKNRRNSLSDEDSNMFRKTRRHSNSSNDSTAQSLTDKHTQNYFKDNKKRNTNKRKYKDRQDAKFKHGKGHNKPQLQNKGDVRELIDLVVTVEHSEEEVAKDIANKLYEKNDELVAKVVSVIGKEKTLELFNEVKKIEASGGMMIMNGTRRRTPGGVFFLLLKSSDGITKEQQSIIFAEQRQEINRYKKKHQKDQRNKKKIEYSELLKREREKVLPELLSRAEAVLASHEKLKSLHMSSDIMVSNPPPSPVTDCHDNSSDVDITVKTEIDNKDNIPVLDADKRREIEAYSDDFLDMNCGDDMDLF